MYGYPLQKTARTSYTCWDPSGLSAGTLVLNEGREMSTFLLFFPIDANLFLAREMTA